MKKISSGKFTCPHLHVSEHEKFVSNGHWLILKEAAPQKLLRYFEFLKTLPSFEYKILGDDALHIATKNRSQLNASYKETIPHSEYEKRVPMASSCWFYPIAVLENAHEEVYFNAKYIRWLIENYPSCSFFAENEKPAVVYNENGTIGYLMPMRGK